MTLRNFKLAPPKEKRKLPFSMMMTLIRWKINGFVNISTVRDDKDPGTLLFHQNLYQNLTKFDTVK